MNKTSRRLCEDDYEEMFKPTMSNKPLKIQHLPTGDVIDFYLPMVIEGAEDYIDFFRAVNEARASDKVVVHINCLGGAVTTAYNIIDVLRSTPADVEMVIEGPCASAASMIMLAGKHWKVTEHAFVMIHVWSGGYYGKWPEVKAEIKFDETRGQEAFRDIYKNFLTDDEIDRALEGKDFYFSSKEVIDRLNNYSAKDARREEILQEITEKYQLMISKEVETEMAKLDKEEAKEEAKKRKSVTPKKES